jgi:hypothetical protein
MEDKKITYDKFIEEIEEMYEEWKEFTCEKEGLTETSLPDFERAIEMFRSTKKPNSLMETFTECPDCGGEVNIDQIDCCCESCGIETTCKYCGEEFHLGVTIGPKEDYNNEYLLQKTKNKTNRSSKEKTTNSCP